MDDWNINFFSGEQFPVEMHRVRVVQHITLPSFRERAEALRCAWYNGYLLFANDIFLDMLTDSGGNAMDVQQCAAMLRADDSYAGSESFFRLCETIEKFFGLPYFLPAHQGRACENIIAHTFMREKTIVLTNYNFTTIKAHVTRLGGQMENMIIDEALIAQSNHPFKGNFDLEKLINAVEMFGRDRIAFVRIECGTNLIGGQPVSLGNIREISHFCRNYGLPLVLDCSLLSDNLYFIKTRESECKDEPLTSIVHQMASLVDLIYYSGRKFGCAHGGGMVTADKKLYEKLRELLPIYEGFWMHGGMSARDMEAMAIGIGETLNLDVIAQVPLFVEFLGKSLLEAGIPVVQPFGGLGCYIDAAQFLSHIPREQYPAGALAAAIYLVGGIRCMEMGTISQQRNDDGSEFFPPLELVRLSIPKRVFTMSHMKFIADRLRWLYDNRHTIGGLKFIEEPSQQRSYFGKLGPIGDWPNSLMARFLHDMPSGV
ncbi:MAG: tryptophanase [Puniceicoccales bacterium]|jgi:tryptophanase|nr:tryptophanase [Puniceicoccales bacterium]